MDERDVDRARTAIESSMKKVPRGVFLIIGALLLVLLFFRPWVQIGAGERGVVLNFGAVQDKVLNEGLHFRVPIMQKVAIMDVKVQKAVTDAVSGSADLQDVTSSVALNYHVVPDKANVVYQTIGVEFKERIIDPQIQEVI